MSFHWKTSDGESRVARSWRRGEGHGVLACIHGLSGCGEQFEPVAARLTRFSVYALELRGQGLDPQPERRAMRLDVEAQHRDIGDFLSAIRDRHPGEPVFLFGESMGSLLSASFAASFPESDLAGLILSVPVVDLARPVPAWLRHLTGFVGHAFPQLKFYPSWFVSGETSSLPLTRDKAYQDSMKDKPHYIRVFTLRFLWELGNLIRQSHTAAASFHKPVLVLAAGRDCFVRVSQIESWFANLSASDKTLNIYPEAYHLLWHDLDREAVLKDVESWLKSRAEAK